ncbi:MAG TPA: DUF4139 domain-containing protein [Candidatus Angelobacter sp.]|nr:DUF4139 domain-containing protein [Candidatus Angelobacter sp.]
MYRKTAFLVFLLLGWIPALAWAQGADQPPSSTDQPAITIYNANFAVVRQSIPLDLQAGVNHITFNDATAHIEPDSVMLRDPLGRRALRILEQNYRNDPVSQQLLLFLNEGKTLDFLAGQWTDKDGQPHQRIVKGKIIRSGYQNQGNPIVDVDGQLQFSLPGQPVFPTLGYGTILKPTLAWVLQTDQPGKSTAELSYVTGGMSWHADYNVVAPTKGDTIDLVGWITIDNKTGKEFDNSRIKLVAGDVNKITPESRDRLIRRESVTLALLQPGAPPVSEKSFDEYHLYTLERPTTLHDSETKQVEFIVASGVKSQRIYVYNGAALDRYSFYSYEQVRNDASYGTQSNPKVWVMQQFKNSKANHLGMPLPKGRLRFYRQDDDGQMEFTGENVIDHTPTDETVRVYTGNAFDIVGERRRTDYHIDVARQFVDESFEIKVRNHKKETVEVRVVEKLYRGTNWEITPKSETYNKLDSQTIEFPIKVPPDGETVISYKVHYTW